MTLKKTAKQSKPVKAEAKTAQPPQWTGGPGADRALFEYVENFRFGKVTGRCDCKHVGRCVHSNALFYLAVGMFYNFLNFKPENYRHYEMPAELQAMRKDLITKKSAYEKLMATIITMLPKNKRGRLRGLLERYESDFENIKLKFFMAVSYARGITDQEDLTTYRLDLIKEIIKTAKDKKNRPFYNRVYFSQPQVIIDGRFIDRPDTGKNFVQPGLVAAHSFEEISLDLHQAADDLARTYKVNKDPKLFDEKLKFIELAGRMREVKKQIADLY